MRALLERLARKRSPEHTAELQATFERIYGPCPACDASILDHPRFCLASARPNTEHSQVPTLRDLIKQSSWQEASQIREFAGTEDAVIFEVFSCPPTEALVLFELHSFADVWQDDQLLGVAVLDDAQAYTLRKIAHDNWGPPLAQYRWPGA